MENIVNENKSEIQNFITVLINELIIVTFGMIVLIIFIAMWMSGYLSQKIEKILIGTKKFSQPLRNICDELLRQLALAGAR